MTNDTIESLRKSSVRLVADAEEAPKSLNTLLEIESPAVGSNQEKALFETRTGDKLGTSSAFKEIVRKFWKACANLQVKR